MLVWLTAGEVHGAELYVERVQDEVHVALYDNCRAYTQANCTILVDAETGDFLEDFWDFHLPQLANVEIRHPEVVPLLHRELNVVLRAELLRFDSLIEPHDLQEHIEWDLLKATGKRVMRG